jgi:hypothetical protein
MIARFEIVSEKTGRPDADRIIFCDGSGGQLFRPETDLELSHWRPNHTPPEYRGDTSTQSCFRFLENPRRAPWTVAVNNHLDVDGILSVYVLVHSEHARQHRDAIIAAAEMGDFWSWGPPESQHVFQGITLLMDKSREQDVDTAAIYKLAFDRIPGLLDGTDPETPAIQASLEPLRRQASQVESGAIVRRSLAERLTHYIVPLSIAGDDNARAAYVPQFNEAISDKCVLWPHVHSRWDDQRVRLVSIERHGGWFHSVWFPGYLWADTEFRRAHARHQLSRRHGVLRPDHPSLLRALAQLQSQEPAIGTWAAGNGASPFHRELQSIFPVVARFNAPDGSAARAGRIQRKSQPYWRARLRERTGGTTAQRSSLLRSPEEPPSGGRTSRFRSGRSRDSNQLLLLHLVEPRPAFGAAAFAALHFTRLLVELAAAHFLLHAGMLHQLAKTTDRLLHRFIVTQTQLDHSRLLSRTGDAPASQPGLRSGFRSGAGPPWTDPPRGRAS